MRLPLFLISAACAASACAPYPPGSAPRSRPAGVLRIATWNVHDLFDAEDRTVYPGDLDEVPLAAAVEAKLARVAAVLDRVDADLVMLQEVENPGLVASLAARSGYPEARLIDAFDPRGIDVALLSRLAVDRYVSHLGELASDGRPLWSRDCVEAHAAEGGALLVAVGSHLVSRITDPAGTRRGEQAERMREIADLLRASEPEALVVVGGDLNDDPAAAALAPLLDDGLWIDPLSVFGLEESWTWLGGGAGARFDYLLVPRADAWRLMSAAVFDGADVEAASDHRPVVLDLLWGR